MTEVTTAPVPTLENVELAEKVLSFIREHEHRWEQGTVLMVPGSAGYELAQLDLATALDCGTCACMAGWTPLVAGKTIERSSWGMTWTGHRPRVDGEALTDWSSAALGLKNWGEALEPHPFDGGNNLEELTHWVAAIRVAYEDQIPVTYALYREMFND